MSKNKKKSYDVVDVYKKLKKHFPHVKLITEDVEVQIGRSYYTFHKFRLRKLNGQAFNPPLKTTISMLQNNEISKKEYKTIYNDMVVAFGLRPKTKKVIVTVF